MNIIKRYFTKISFSRKNILVVIFVFVSLLLIVTIIYQDRLYKDVPSPISAQEETVTPVNVITAEVKQFGLKIDKISLVVPVVKDVDGADKSAYIKALKNGVAHYKGTALPAAGSNIFIFGHSSSATDNGPYARAFEKLNDLEKNDPIVVYFENKEFIYKVSRKRVVEKDDIAVLNPTLKETLTLMTCWPIGTNEKRLIVQASPD